MNINISKKKSSDQSKKSNLAMGLNSRGGDGTKTTTGMLRRRPPSAFDDDNDDDTDDNDDDTTTTTTMTRSGRDAVNHAIAKQQAAIRAQTAATTASLTDTSIYDYDGVYDSIHSTTTTTTTTTGMAITSTTDTTKKSRYIEDLMKTAKVRKMERDIAYDRKVARDQRAEEDAEPEFRNKDRFITSSYKRQLDERHQYEQQESIRQKIEEENDVTKRSDVGLGIASFYGNISKQSHSTNDSNHKDCILPSSTSKDDVTVANVEGSSYAKADRSSTFDDDVEKQESSNKKSHIGTMTTNINNHHHHHPTTTTTSMNDNDDFMDTRTKLRFRREEKVKAARERYFQRHNNINPVVME